MKTILVCYILLYPHAGDGYNTTVIRINKKAPEACQASAAKHNAHSGKNNCSCVAPGKRPSTL